MLKIYNTLGRELQEFHPIEKNKIRFYQCGPTVYSRQHIGNLSSAVRGDLIRRSLEYLGYEVMFTRNVTDVGHLTGENEGDADKGEDKLSKGAKKEGITPKEIAKKYFDLYKSDLKKANVKEPTYETVATEYIDQMGEMVQVLIDKGFAYATELAIYFDVSKKQDYTKLSGQKLDKNQQGAGHGDVSDSGKKNSTDFAIWFFKAGSHKNALQTWEYEFKGIDQKTTLGFPGWHIECSAMSKSTLGDTIDIHMGGVEHIPVHHTNEIAQSESSNGVNFVNYWIHHELLSIDGGKMSKSLGNVYSIDDLEAKGYSALDYRYFLLQANYKAKQNFTWDALEGSKTALEKIRKNINSWQSNAEIDNSSVNINNRFKLGFVENIQNDFNIPGALGVIWEMIKSDISDTEKLNTILDFDKILGLNLDQIDSKIQIDIDIEVQDILDQRAEARKNKQWDISDRLRDELIKKYNIKVLDTSNGQEVEIIK